MRVPNAAVPVLTHASHRPGVYVQASSYDDEDDDDDSDHTDTDTDTTSSRPEPSRQHVPGQHHRRPPVQVRRRPPSRPPPRENNNTMYEEARDGQKSASRRPHSRSRQLFELSMTDPAAHMPPTCWTAEPIPNRHVDKRLDHRFEKQWNDEFAEFSTRKRLYCPAKHCGHWIESEDLRRREDGRKCGRCRRCKTKGWQRCHRCKAMVELDPGCNHMICRCGAEFCMLCGSKGKTCPCPCFNCDAVEKDGLPHMNMALDREEVRTGPAPTPGPNVRPGRPNYDEYGRVTSPQPHGAPLAQHAGFDRASSGPDHASCRISRPRGHRTSQERRLADRFNPEGRQMVLRTVSHQGESATMPPPPVRPMPAVPQPPPAASVPAGVARRHTTDKDWHRGNDGRGYGATERYHARVTEIEEEEEEEEEEDNYSESAATEAPRRRRRRRRRRRHRAHREHRRGPESEPGRVEVEEAHGRAVLAGLAGVAEKGPNRVLEWMTYVKPGLG
ncbi:hypothetical protein P8C59_000788 [Phyllachora maydis]|uniref:DAD domain-containing protein n=1 Tax=Phyllachora maydis TaxID=1825666 RepID=A0AAD9HWZ3_9PEZI|nr:hypothetical protein P8C59_000788 [Phyllachora maydis]